MKTFKITSIIAITVVLVFLLLKTTLYAESPGDVVTVKGVFSSITRPNVTLKSDDGTEYLIHIGPPWYWEENKYSITLDASTEIYGKLEQETKEIYAYKIIQNGITIKLVDDNNNPLWWNSGKGNKNGWGSNGWRNNGSRNNNCCMNGNCCRNQK